MWTSKGAILSVAQSPRPLLAIDSALLDLI